LSRDFAKDGWLIKSTRSSIQRHRLYQRINNPLNTRLTAPVDPFFCEEMEIVLSYFSKQIVSSSYTICRTRRARAWVRRTGLPLWRRPVQNAVFLRFNSAEFEQGFPKMLAQLQAILVSFISIEIAQRIALIID
jgi:hypothetical protein